LLAFRLVWGVLGPEYSRISSMARATRRLALHLQGLIMLRPAHHLGHNPAGSAMIFALFAVLTGLVATGLMVQGGEEKQGPLAGVITYATGNGAKEVHEVLVWLLIAMVAVHVAGVAAETRLLRTPLVRAMITGWIPLPAGTPLPEGHRAAHPLRALAWLGGFAVAAGLVLTLLGRIPPFGIPTMTVDETWATECGDCHAPYHPSLLPRASWRALMADLGDHFGDDASLPDDKAAPIAAFLDAYAAEAWDTEAARRFAVLDPARPLQITATPYWVRKHAEVDPALFAAPSVKSRSNCSACHTDAASGSFDDQAIRLPLPTSGVTP
jgi:cytochrome b